MTIRELEQKVSSLGVQGLELTEIKPTGPVPCQVRFAYGQMGSVHIRWDEFGRAISNASGKWCRDHAYDLK